MDIFMFLARNLGKLSPSTTTLFLCDMQAKFRPSSSHFDTTVHHSTRVLSATQLMSVPTMATEQYPKGLGANVPEPELGEFDISPHIETCFTLIRPLLTEELILNTTMDLLEMGVDVHIPVDLEEPTVQSVRDELVVQQVDAHECALLLHPQPAPDDGGRCDGGRPGL